MAAAGGAEPAAVLIFSYGSNNACQLTGRVRAAGDAPLPPPLGATLHGYARVFARMSQLWCASACRSMPGSRAGGADASRRGGGVANLVAAEGHSARGALCRLSPAQAARLDSYERGYVRTPVRVAVDGADAGALAPRHL